MDFLKRALEATLSPTGIITLLFAIGIVLSFAARYRRASHRLLLLGGLLFLILLYSPLSEYLILQLEKDYPPMLQPPAALQIDRIIVLAGYAEDHKAFPVTTQIWDHTIGPVSEGLRLYRLLPGSKMILSGGTSRPEERPVAAVMADFLQQTGVPARDLIVEGRSTTTYENLVEVKKLVGTAPFILVAQACDLRRAMGVARKLQLNAVAAPACYWALQYHTNIGPTEEIVTYLESMRHPTTERLFRIQWAYHEYLGYLWYRLLGRI